MRAYTPLVYLSLSSFCFVDASYTGVNNVELLPISTDKFSHTGELLSQLEKIDRDHDHSLSFDHEVDTPRFLHHFNSSHSQHAISKAWEDWIVNGEYNDGSSLTDASEHDAINVYADSTVHIEARDPQRRGGGGE